MNAPEDWKQDHPPGFEPPTDVNVPWYAWVLWPAALLTGIGLTMLLFRGCLSTLSS